MGRPLFSKTYQASPAVREPETPCPYEKWSYINAFDPDADDFFDSENAVYEAFVEVADVAAQEGQEQANVIIIRGHTPARVIHPPSPTFSEESLSDVESPMAVGPEESSRLVAVAPFGDRTHTGMDDRAFNTFLDRLHSPVGLVSSERRVPGMAATTAPSERVTSHPLSRQRSRSDVQNHVQRQLAERYSRTSDITPIPIPVTRTRRASAMDEHPITPSRNPPSTPPSHLLPQFSPSPPPSVTPRLYSWASRSRDAPTSPSMGMSPLTNSSARMSYAHIAPNIVRMSNIMA